MSKSEKLYFAVIILSAAVALVWLGQLLSDVIIERLK